MKVVEVSDELRSDRKALESIFVALDAGKKIVFRFINDRDKAEFMNELGVVGASAGHACGAYKGGLAAINELFALGVAGNEALAVGIGVGAIVGSILGALVGFALGAFLAYFIYGVTGKIREIKTKYLKDNRVRVKLLA